jgi:hypothetical protein
MEKPKTWLKYQDSGQPPLPMLVTLQHPCIYVKYVLFYESFLFLDK